MTDDSRSPTGGPPKVVTWFKVYAGALCVTYVAVAAFSIVFFAVSPHELEMPAVQAHVTGALLLAMGVVLSAACLVPLVAPRRPWLWTYDLVVICLGLTSVCCMLASIPLLIFWLKPETKAWFGRS